MAIPKSPRDPNQLAKFIVDVATGEPGQSEKAKEITGAAKHGRKGGLLGGKARAAALPPEKRTEIAQKAAKACWAKAEHE